MRARLALLAAATCLAGAANAATIYPLDRATVLSSSPFDFKVELDAVYDAGDIDVTVNGKPYAEVFGQEAEFVTDEKGKNDESLGSALILRDLALGHVFGFFLIPFLVSIGMHIPHQSSYVKVISTSLRFSAGFMKPISHTIRC